MQLPNFTQAIADLNRLIEQATTARDAMEAMMGIGAGPVVSRPVPSHAPAKQGARSEKHKQAMKDAWAKRKLREAALNSTPAPAPIEEPEPAPVVETPAEVVVHEPIPVEEPAAAESNEPAKRAAKRRVQ